MLIRSLYEDTEMECHPGTMKPGHFFFRVGGVF